MTSVPPSVPPGWPLVSIANAHRLMTAPGMRFEIEPREIRGVFTKTWKQAPPTLRDVFTFGTETYAERELLVYEDEHVTTAAFARAVRTLAHTLTAEGLRKGERVAIVMRNLPEWPVAYFATLVCGAIATPLNAWWTGAELAYGLSNAGCAFALFDGERYTRIEPELASCASLRRVFVTRHEGPLPPRARALEEVIGASRSWAALPERALPEVEIAPEDDATIFYTSGTTGKAKGAVATHRNITTNIITQMFSMARAYIRRGEIPPVPGPGDAQRVSLLSVPFFHVTGCNSTLVPALYSGSKVVLMRKWDPEHALALIERERVTSAGGVPTIAWQLLEHPAREKYDLSSLLYIAYGGAPSAPELVRRIKTVFPQVAPGNSWGMTETSGTFSSNYGEDYFRRPDSCGVPAAVGEAKVMDAEGSESLATGMVGELWVRGPQVIHGYWGMPEETAHSFVDGWVKTGDLARLDDEGFVYIVDRKKDILIRGGENIYCIQVESALYDHPHVMDAAVVGIPHRTLGEEPGAIVHLTEGSQLTESELRAFVAQRLAAFEVPVRILFWPEPLPRNPAGKIMKRELKSAFPPAPAAKPSLEG